MICILTSESVLIVLVAVVLVCIIVLSQSVHLAPLLGFEAMYTCTPGDEFTLAVPERMSCFVFHVFRVSRVGPFLNVAYIIPVHHNVPGMHSKHVETCSAVSADVK